MTDDIVRRSSDEQIRTAYLARYDEMEAEIVVEVLREAGIFALTKRQITEASHAPYVWQDDAGVVLVDAARVDEARALIEQALPEHLASIAAEMDLLEQEVEQEDLEDD